jgi:hypothetical protein
MWDLSMCMVVFMDDSYMIMKMILEWMWDLYGWDFYVYGCETWMDENFMYMIFMYWKLYICVWFSGIENWCRIENEDIWNPKK